MAARSRTRRGIGRMAMLGLCLLVSVIVAYGDDVDIDVALGERHDSWAGMQSVEMGRQTQGYR